MSADVEVDTVQGRVRGRWRGQVGERGRSAAFLGIPFAKPPVGDLRFAAPEPPEPWDGVRDALEYGATAQRGHPGVTLIPEPSIAGDSTLNVNVFTPRPGETGAALPVLVWIHGGGYFAGSPASPWYDGCSFNRDGVVTVSASYRLGFDGFGEIDGAPSNRGVRDWIAALEWVQQNIAAFGGDPNRVTVAGQSAGGGAALTLLAMPTAAHLFHAVWSLSGAPADVSRERARAASARLAHLAGVPATRAGFASAPEQTLIDLQERAGNGDSDDPMAGVLTALTEGLAWGPVIDGDLVPKPTVEAIAAGAGADKPLVLGATDDEFTFALNDARGKLRFVPAALALGKMGLPKPQRRRYLTANRPRRPGGTAAVIGRYLTDRLFRTTVVRVAEARGSAPTWVYAFSWPSPTHGWAVHCLDVPFWFDCLDAPAVTDIAGENPPQALADAVHGAAAQFVREGNPGWEAWSSESGATRVWSGDPGADAVIADGYAEVRPLLG